ncbi:glycoside hydrolase [Streptomyces sp. NBC_00988]|uniref:sialidase family protein n=1 Tax=Streptomyces sp. NBC_00988 TaxID=2903704 RepID=UPI003869075A|nr:glycoside hydrolase [Streptomyces sp. NBC_00988]
MPVTHAEVYREPGRFAAWPANYGMWSWGDEIVLIFASGHLNTTANGFHAVAPRRPFDTVEARSTDGGLTWNCHAFPGNIPNPYGLSVDEHLAADLATGPAARALPAAPGVDFADGELALMCGRTGLHSGGTSWYYASTDRCRTWQGPYALPELGAAGLAARADWVPLGPREALLLLTSTKSDGQEGRVLCARTRDSGTTFERLSWVGDEPEGFAIMPATVRLDSGRLLSAIRSAGSDPTAAGTRHWIDLYASDDLGGQWSHLGRPVDSTGYGGNPATLTLLPDGRLCLVYGYRDQPYGIRARLSSDGGVTWSAETVLRSDAGCHDLGYPRTVLRADGSVVTAYYYNDSPAGERYIAATVWTP